MSELTAIQPKNDAKQKMKRPETTALVIHDASVAKSKYATSATLATKTMNPYGIAPETVYRSTATATDHRSQALTGQQAGGQTLPHCGTIWTLKYHVSPEFQGVPILFIGIGSSAVQDRRDLPTTMIPEGIPHTQ